MEIHERRSGQVAILSLEGRLTVTDEIGLLKEAVLRVLADGAMQVLLDLAGVDYIDSTRLGELISAHIAVTKNGATLKLVHTPPRISALLEMAGLTRVFDQYPSIDAARAGRA
jgi:anti-sigma B factor antagonist